MAGSRLGPLSSRYEGRHRADLNAGKTCFASGTRGGGSVEADHRVEAPFGKIQHGFALPGKAGVKAFSAKDTPVGIIVKNRMLLDDRGLFKAFVKFSWFQANPKELRDPLKLTSSVPRTVTAIHMVDGHEETKGAFLKAPHGWRVGPHHHPFPHFNGTGGHRFLQAFNLHKAEPA